MCNAHSSAYKYPAQSVDGAPEPHSKRQAQGEGRRLAVGCHNKANRKWNRIKCIIRFWPGWPRASIRVVREGKVQMEGEREGGTERERARENEREKGLLLANAICNSFIGAHLITVLVIRGCQMEFQKLHIPPQAKDCLRAERERKREGERVDVRGKRRACTAAKKVGKLID